MNTYTLKVKTLLATLALGTVLSANSAIGAEGLSYQDIVCESQSHQFKITVIMPNGMTPEEMNKEAMKTCNSIETVGTEAVCDTDTNCMYWDEYKQYGVAKVMFSHDDDKGMRWIEATCLDSTKHVIDDPSELGVICAW